MGLLSKLVPFLLTCLIDFAYCSSGVCYREHSGVNRTQETFCCDYFEDRNGTCVECSKGFESFQGQPCSPCSTNRYGEFCVDICDCEAVQICDNVKGCIEVPATRSLSTQNDMSTNITVTEYATKVKTASVSDYFVILSASGIFILLLNIAFCLICVAYFKRKHRKQQHIMRTENVQNHTTHEYPSEPDEHENTYEEIDETVLQAEIVVCNINADDESNGSSTSNTSGYENSPEDYLNPYQPIVKETESRCYTNLMRESAVYKDDLPQTTNLNE